MPDDPTVVVEEEKPVAEETVTVETTPAGQPTVEETLAAKVKEDFDKLYGSRLESLESRLRQALRQGDQLRTELQKVGQVKSVVAVPTPQAQKDELDQLVESGRWKEAVSKLASKEAEALFEKQQDVARQQQALTERHTRFEAAKATVMSRYPDLHTDTGNEDSLISQTFNHVLNEQPWLLSEALGPIEAMRLMEQRLQEQGFDLRSAQAATTSLEPNKEIVRRHRANFSGLPTSRPPSSTTITLTKSEKEFLDFNGIDPKEYAKNKQMLESQQAVEI